MNDMTLPKFDHNMKHAKIHSSHEMKSGVMRPESFDGCLREFFTVNYCALCEKEEFIGIYSYHNDKELTRKCKG